VLDANGIVLRIAKVPDFTPARFTILGWKVAGIYEMVGKLGEKESRSNNSAYLTRMSPVFGQLPMAIRSPGSRTRTVISSHYQSMWAVERSSGAC
jgi:hypothetical protein